MLWEVARLHHSSCADTLSARPVADDAIVPSGARLGPYVIGRCLGRGGMGVVYAAYDPRVERKIALKLVTTTRAGEADLLREAQLMGRLGHPNVVAIHDVGVVGEHLFLALELVEGVTLRQWMTAPRTWREVLAVFEGAGRGLAAAHEAGIVHRDFKPENVLCGRDGRVRVADFGLASAAAHESGRRSGTPAYMAPEQRDGKFDPRSDQYAFCVALHEALAGERPRATRAPHAEPTTDRSPRDARPEPAAERNTEGRGRSTPGPRRVPRWVRRVVSRGLAPDPDDRWPSMAALLDALSASRRHGRRRVAISVAIAGVIGVAAIVGIYTRPTAQAQAPCRGAVDVDGAWTLMRRQGLVAAFLRTGRPNASESTRKVTAQLDHYAGDWVAMQREACEATRIRGDQSDEVLTLRMTCLDRRASALRELIDRLIEIDPETIGRAGDAIGALPEIARCQVSAVVRSRTTPPESEAIERAVATLDRRLNRVSSLVNVGRVNEALPEVKEVVASARQLGYRPVLARALFELGFDESSRGEIDAAIAALRESVWAAEASSDDQTAARAWTELAGVLGQGKADLAGAMEAEQRALAAFERLGPPRGPLQMVLDFQLGVALEQLGDHASARARLERALATAQASMAPEDPRWGMLLHVLGNIAASQNRNPEALDLLRRALAHDEQVLGPSHPRIGGVLTSLGMTLALEGRNDEARRQLQRAVTLEEPDSSALALTLFNLAQLEEADGRYAQALPIWERGLALLERSVGRQHPDVRARRCPPPTPSSSSARCRRRCRGSKAACARSRRSTQVRTRTPPRR